MRVFSEFERLWARPACLLIGLTFTFAAATAQAEPPPGESSARASLIVHLDQAGILKLPDRTATLVIGNPLIADANVQPGGIAVITGKGYGATNLVALDRFGATLMEHPIHVLAPRDYIVVVYRGVERESYSCTPTCERRITLGDSTDYFTGNLTQITNLSTQAQGGAAK
jgi:hypothetical protein